MTDSATKPLVSVVVPTYERPDMLVEAVETVESQTYQNVELIIVDDNSTVPAVTQFADRAFDDLVNVRFLRHRQNRGASAARNTGVVAASGEFVAFLDDDDRWRPEKLQRQVAALQRADDDVGVVFTGQEFVDQFGQVTNVVRPTTSGPFTENLVKGRRYGTFSTVMVRVEVFDQIGYPDERLTCWQDREWYLRLADRYDYISLPELLTIRQIGAVEQISDRFESRRDVTRPLLLEKHRQRFADRGRPYERWFLSWLSRGMANSAMDNGRYRESLRYLFRQIQYAPTKASTYLSLARFFVVVGGRYTMGPVRGCKRLYNRLAARLSYPKRASTE